MFCLWNISLRPVSSFRPKPGHAEEEDEAAGARSVNYCLEDILAIACCRRFLISWIQQLLAKTGPWTVFLGYQPRMCPIGRGGHGRIAIASIQTLLQPETNGESKNFIAAAATGLLKVRVQSALPILLCTCNFQCIQND